LNLSTRFKNNAKKKGLFGNTFHHLPQLFNFMNWDCRSRGRVVIRYFTTEKRREKGIEKKETISRNLPTFVSTFLEEQTK